MQPQQTFVSRSQHLSPTASHPATERSDALTEAFKTLGAAVRFEANTEIQAEDEPADFFYQVVSGAVRTYKLLSDGRRQINAFHLPGDVIELEVSQNHRFSADATTPSIIRVAKRSAMIGLAARNHELATEIWRRTANNLQFAQEHMMLLGRRNAEERLANFLLEMAERSSYEGTIDLPMPRQDIADYLGLTIETVSRTLTHLASISTINLSSSRHVHLRNRAALRRLNA